MPKSSVFWFALTAIILLSVGLIVTWWRWDWLRSGGSETASNGDTLRNAGLMLGGVLALIFALWRGWVAQQQSATAQRQADIAQQSLLNERYERGAEMLGNDVLSVRLGGIFALRRLAEEHPEQYHIQIMELLCAFVRNPTGKERDAALVFIDDDETAPIPREDVVAAMVAIGRRTESGLQTELSANFRLDLHGADIGGISVENMNWCRSNLRRANLSYVNLRQVDLSDSNLEWARMYQSELRRVDFTRTNLCHANLFNTSATCADFSLSDLRDSTMSRMKLVTTWLVGADLRNAALHNIDFGTSDLTSAKLDGAGLEGAIFGRTQEMSFTRNSEPILTFAGLTQRQLDEAKAHPNYPPTIAEGTVDIETGEPLVWRGKPPIEEG